MECPVCKTEAYITSQKMVYNQQEGKLFRVLKYSCRNRNCEKYEQEVGEERIPTEFEPE